MSTIVISEIGENHLGNIEIAKKMIRKSKDAGADFAKFQLYDPERTSMDDPERDWFFKVALSRGDVAEVVQECREVGIKPLFTCWDTIRAGWCLEEKITEIKLASFHITDQKLLNFITNNFKTVFLSTGMSTVDDVKKAVENLKVEKLYLLHCVSDYPLKYENVNLKVMETLRSFSEYIGYSDHTIDITAVLAAVAMGAQVIEKHFTLSKDLPGTDHVLSATPEEFAVMVREIRKIETIMGAPNKTLTSSESESQAFLRTRFKRRENNMDIL